MEFRNDLTTDYVRSILDYCPKTGIFRWKSRPLEHFPNNRIRNSWNSTHCGKIAGGLRNDGYLIISINKKHYYAQRLAWLIMMGQWPKLEIDHKDLNPSNNRWKNYRLATSTQNHCNKSLSSNNTSGFKNVTWHAQNKKWMVKIRFQNKDIYIGTYKKKCEAIKRCKEVLDEYHGEFARIA